MVDDTKTPEEAAKERTKFAKPDSLPFRAHFVQKRRKKRKEEAEA